MNNKGAIFSGFMYVLLMFFLLSLATLLTVLNNSKKISNKAREGAENIINNEASEFSFDLKGINTVCLNLGDAYTDVGREVTAINVENLPLTVSVSSDFVQNQIGTFTITYTAKDKGKEKSVERKVYVLKNEYNFTGNTQEFIAYCDGYYTVELIGADHANGKGGYSKGTIKLKSNEKVFVNVGEYIASANSTSFNGGTSTNNHYPGGGATDIRLLNKLWNNLESLKSRIMVAGGAGAGNGVNLDGGGLVGQKSGVATGGTQTSPGVNETPYTGSAFGVGGNGFGGGGGYYGGGGGLDASGGGAGGSGYISGGAGSNAISNDLALTHTNNTLHFSGKYFVNTASETGKVEIDRPANSHGKAKITYIGANYPKTNTNFNNVRYIKDCTNGSNKSVTNDWIEIQVIKDGVNIALGKQVSGAIAEDPSKPYSLITDGIVDQPNSFGSSITNGPPTPCITIDLGKSYDVDEIAVWHRYSDQATFTDTITAVSSDNSTWQTIMSNLGVETTNGHRASAWN